MKAQQARENELRAVISEEDHQEVQETDYGQEQYEMNMNVGQHQVEMGEAQGVYLEGDGFDEDDEYGEDGESE